MPVLILLGIVLAVVISSLVLHIRSASNKCLTIIIDQLQSQQRIDEATALTIARMRASVRAMTRPGNG